MGSKETIAPWRVRLARYTDLFLYALIGTAVLFVSHPIWEAASDKLTQVLAPLPLSLQWALLIAGTVLPFMVFVRAGAFRWRYLLSVNILRYPPTWFAVLFGALPYSAYCASKDPFDAFRYSPADFVWLVGMLVGAPFILSVLVDFYGQLVEPRKTVTHADSGLERLDAIFETAHSLEEWLKSDEPIDTPDRDCFDHAYLAEHVAKGLLKTSPVNIALTGPFGCGKSSILCMTEWYLRAVAAGKVNDLDKADRERAKKILVVRVSGWSLQGESAVSYILSKATERIATVTDSTAISSVPRAYVDALRGSKNWFLSAPGQLLHSADDAESALRRLDNVLACARNRLVIFIEDLDRTTDGADPSSEAALSHACQIASLLDRLGKLQSVAFVLAAGDNFAQTGTLLRITDHTWRVPALSIQRVSDLILEFRKQCRNRYLADIDPEDDRTRENRF